MSDFEKFRKIQQYIGPFRLRRAWVTGLCTVQIAIETSLPALMGQLVTMVQNQEALQDIFRYGFFLLAVGAIEILLNVWQNYEWHSFSAEYVDYFRIKMLEGAFKKDPTFIKTHQDDLQSRILNDGGSVAGQIGIGFPMLILNLFRIVFVLFVMSRMSMLLSVIVLTVVPIYTGFFQGVTQKARDNSRKEREAFSSLNSSLEENLNGIFQIKIFQKESFFLDRFKRQTLDYEKYIKAIRRFTSYSYGIGEMITTILPIITLSIGAIEVANGQMTMGNLFAFYFYLNFLYEPMNNLADYFTSLQVTFGVADRVMELMELCLDSPIETLSALNINEIRIENLSFSYTPGIPVLDNFSLTLKKGDIVGVIGSSGSGKTTLAELLIKLHDTYDGSIYVNDVEMRTIDRSSYYRRLSYLDQSPFLFKGSLKENIAFTDINTCKLSRVLHDAKLDSIRENEKAEDVIIQAAGQNLSGGEKQRIALARALYKESDLLVLDEFTSALDEPTEAEIIDHIRTTIGKGRIILLITHRKAPLSICNKVIDLSRPEPETSNAIRSDSPYQT